MIQEGSRLWQYLSLPQRTLASDGAFLVADTAIHHDVDPTDYSYLVFPFAKLYEGFLKQLFTDLGIMSQREYRSDHYRIGRTLSPGMVGRLRGRSAYGQIEERFGKDLATRLWHAWKNGRNMVFHYFAHNYRALALDQAKTLITVLCDAMEDAVVRTNVRPMRQNIE
jgi:hypothetical protein